MAIRAGGASANGGGLSYPTDPSISKIDYSVIDRSITQSIDRSIELSDRSGGGPSYPTNPSISKNFLDAPLRHASRLNEYTRSKLKAEVARKEHSVQ